jgi:hypothetical protein
MIGHRVIVGLSSLFALMFCVFATQSASAATATNTTAFTCVDVGPFDGDFADAHCDTQEVNGKYAHQAMSLDSTKEIELSNAEVTEGTKKSEPAVLKSKIGLTNVEIECTKVASRSIVIEKTLIREALIHNVEDILGEHTVTGLVALRLSSCTAKVAPLKCTIKEPIDSETLEFRGREKLGAGANEMGVEFSGGGSEILLSIEFQNKGSEECFLKGKTFQLKGSAIATSGPTTESSQTNKRSGSTLVFTPKKEMQKLKLGVESAEFSTLLTVRAPNGAGVALTTVT